LKEGETGNWRRPLNSVVKKALSLIVRRLVFYSCWTQNLRTQSCVTGRQTCC